jgi:hemerythrin-like domain-containing protein
MADQTVNYLRRDHRDLRGVLAHLELLLDALDDEKSWTAERCGKFESISDFLSTRLTQLYFKECHILYPALDGLFSLREGPLALLCDEHKEVVDCFGDLCRAGSSLCVSKNKERDIRAFIASGRSSLELLRNHLYKEDRVLFPMVARFLTPERDVELLKKMEAVGTEEILGPGRDRE